MELQQILGNDGLMTGLTAAIRSGKASHSYLISGPAGSGKRTLARWLCAALECTGSAPPCGVCAQCHKVLAGSHADVITVDDPEKKTISVNLARDAKTDLYIRPNEGKRKIYLFPRAQDMQLPAQNALLKVLEEPPAYGAFLLLSDRPERLLPTIRSRCVELRLAPVPEQTALAWLRERFPAASDTVLRAAYRRGGGYLGQAAQELEGDCRRDPLADALLEAYAEGDRMAMTEAIWKLEKYEREKLGNLLRSVQSAIGEALAVKNGASALSETAERLAAKRTAADLASAYRSVSELLRAAETNGGVGHICGCLTVRLR